jgi:hypothetical protein
MINNNKNLVMDYFSFKSALIREEAMFEGMEN